MDILSDFGIGELTAAFSARFSARERQVHSRARITLTRARQSDGAAQSVMGHVSGLGSGTGGHMRFATAVAVQGVWPRGFAGPLKRLFTGNVSVPNPGAGDSSIAVGMQYASEILFHALRNEDDFGVTRQIICGGFGHLRLRDGNGGPWRIDSGGAAASQLVMSLDFSGDALTWTPSSRDSGLARSLGNTRPWTRADPCRGADFFSPSQLLLQRHNALKIFRPFQP